MLELKMYRFWELESDIQKRVLKRYKKTRLVNVMREYLSQTFAKEIKEIAGDLGAPNAFEVSVDEDAMLSIEIKSGSVADLWKRLNRTQTPEKEWILERAEDMIQSGQFRFTILCPVIEISNDLKDGETMVLGDIFDRISKYYVKIANDWVDRMMKDTKYCMRYLCGEEMTNMMLPSQFGYFTEGGNLVTVDDGE